MKHFQPFGCKAYLHIPKSVRRKHHKGRAELGIFVGFDEQTYPGYKFYRPLYRDYVVTAHCRFAKWIRRSIHAELTPTGDTPTDNSGNIEDFQYLRGTYHIDPEDGLLYETTRIEEKSYPNRVLSWSAIVVGSCPTAHPKKRKRMPFTSETSKR